ncbi:MAG: iron-containing redox enzyme family protein [Blastocatellales bacterium]|nr:iron-containing redox enzyme family protein [Blastocatellales bacterium]
MSARLQPATEAMPVDQFLGELLSFIEEHHPKNSKMIRAISEGTASMQAIQGFAREFYAYSAFSLRPFAALVSNAPDDFSLKLMLQNFAGEAGFLGTPSHPVVFRQFALAAGLSDEDLDTHIPLPSTLGGMFGLDHFLRGPFDEAVAGFGYAIEGPAAAWGKLLHDGFKNKYNFDEKAMQFWVIHLEEDESGEGLEAQHGENARKLMQRFASTLEQQTRIRKAFVYSALVFENFWNGMDQFLE